MEHKMKKGTCVVLYILFLSNVIAQVETYVQINSNTHFIVTSPSHRRCGGDPRGLHSDTLFKVTRVNDIPGARYGYQSIGDLYSDEAIESIEFMYTLLDSSEGGSHTIELVGDSLRAYWIDCSVSKDVPGRLASWRFEYKGALEKDSTADFFVALTTDTLSATSAKIVTASTLRRDIAAMRRLNWFASPQVAEKYLGVVNSYESYRKTENITDVHSILMSVLREIEADSASALTSEACRALRPDIEYLLRQLPTAPLPSLVSQLVNSTGTLLTTGSLQYYDSSWKDATNNNDGTFSISTTLTSVSLRMTYEGGSQQKNNIPVGPDTVVFQTVNTQVKLQNSQGALIDTGTVHYYAGSWRTFGTTANGVSTKELLPVSYTFRMTYASGSNDQQQDIGVNPVIIFQTVNAAVQLKNSQGALIDQGTVQYYSNSWKSFGTTSNGIATKELLPNNYTFRMSYASATLDKQQNIGSNPTVVFQTVLASVQLKNSLGNPIDTGRVQYYFSSWKDLGTTVAGVATKELLPVSYTFRMTHETVSNDKVQNIATNSTVPFSTVLCTVTVKNAQAQPVENAMISYYSTVWKQIGPTVGGQVTKELLPANLTLRMTLGSATQNKQQNVGTSALVEFVVQ